MLVVIIAMSFSYQAYAANNTNTNTVRKDILKASAKSCTPDYCRPKIKNIIGNYAIVLYRKFCGI